jgi:hypothetical protein
MTRDDHPTATQAYGKVLELQKAFVIDLQGLWEKAHELSR